MKKKYRILNRNGLFQKAYGKGDYEVNGKLITYVRKNKKKYIRLGITTSKKIGKAVKRNRSKRVIFAAFQSVLKENNYLQGKGYDCVFVARTQTGEVKMGEIKKVMEKQLIKLGVMEKPKTETKSQKDRQ